MKKLIILAAAAVILIPLGMWWFSTENVIKRRTNHLMDVLSMTEGAGGPLRQGKVYSMNGMLAPRVTLAIPDVSEANGTFDKPTVKFYPGARAASLILFDPGQRDRTRFGAGIVMHSFLRNMSLEVDVFEKKRDEAGMNASTAVIATL